MARKKPITIWSKLRRVSNTYVPTIPPKGATKKQLNEYSNRLYDMVYSPEQIILIVQYCEHHGCDWLIPFVENEVPVTFISTYSLDYIWKNMGYDGYNETNEQYGHVCAYTTSQPMQRTYDKKRIDRAQVLMFIDTLYHQSYEVVANTVNHELVHVLQYRNNELKPDINGFIFHGRLYRSGYYHLEEMGSNIIHQIKNVPFERDAYFITDPKCKYTGLKGKAKKEYLRIYDEWFKEEGSELCTKYGFDTEGNYIRKNNINYE